MFRQVDKDKKIHKYSFLVMLFTEKNEYAAICCRGSVLWFPHCLLE